MYHRFREHMLWHMVKLSIVQISYCVALEPKMSSVCCLSHVVVDNHLAHFKCLWYNIHGNNSSRRQPNEAIYIYTESIQITFHIPCKILLSVKNNNWKQQPACCWGCCLSLILHMGSNIMSFKTSFLIGQAAGYIFWLLCMFISLF